MIDTSYIIPPVSRELLVAELKHKYFFRKTNNGEKEIYITTAHQSPNVMREIGRLRELSYALDGGGTGKDCDLDEFDTLPEPYCFKQLIVWNPKDLEIVGGYRFIHGSNMQFLEDGTVNTPTAHLFQFSDEFVQNYLPYTLELGRAFVQPAYQPSVDLRKGIFSLDNLWDGLAGLPLEVPETRYYFGKITMYPQMNSQAKDAILFFMQKYFPDPEGLVWPYEPLPIKSDLNSLNALFTGRSYKENMQILSRYCRGLGENVPALVSAYANLCPTALRCFGTSINRDFGDTDETGILVPIRDIVPEKWERHAGSYAEKNPVFDRNHLFKINMKRLPWWKNINEDERVELRRLRMLKRQAAQNVRAERKRIRRIRRENRRSNSQD